MQIFNGRRSVTWEAFIYQIERTAKRQQWEKKKKKICRPLQCLADVALEYAYKVRTDDDSKSLRKALKQRFRKKDGDQIWTQAFLRGSKDKDSARHVIESNPDTINKALKQMKTSKANQMAIYGSKSAHRQVFFDDGTVSPSDKGNMSSPLENEMRYLTQIVTKLAGFMVSTNLRYHWLADQYNVGPSNQYNRGRSIDQYTRGRSSEQ